MTWTSTAVRNQSVLDRVSRGEVRWWHNLRLLLATEFIDSGTIDRNWYILSLITKKTIQKRRVPFKYRGTETSKLPCLTQVNQGERMCKFKTCLEHRVLFF